MSKQELQNPRGGTRPGVPRIPWNAQPAWSQANQTLQHLCTRHWTALDSVHKIAQDLQSQLETLFPVLDSLCNRTCAVCPTPCCQVATVWFDFKDLVFLHLGAQAIATGQLSRTQEGACCCCGPGGCRLPRLSRPWTCSWYLCPAQKNLLVEMPEKTLVLFADTVAAIKQLRKKLEAEFIRITS